MSTETMESAIAMDAAAILEIADLQDRDLDRILEGIRHRANNILATLNEGAPEAWTCKRNGHHRGPCNSRCKPRAATTA